jgi:hypothetical protein
MALNHRCRLFYRRMLLAFLMIIHFYHLTLFQNQYEVIFSTLACIPLFNHKLTERIFYVLQNKRMIYMLALLTLILLFTPHGFISAITVATYIYGAVLYPSMRIREKMMMPKTRYEIKQAPYSIVPIYFRWRDSI